MSAEIVIAVIAAVAPTITAAAAWANLRARTNGKGPLGIEQKEQGERLGRIELHTRDILRWQLDHMSEHSRRP